MTTPATTPTPVPTGHPRLLAWVAEVTALTSPDAVVWCDGTDTQWQQLTEQLIAAGSWAPR